MVLIIPPQNIKIDHNEIKEQIEKLKKQGFSSKDIVKIISTLNGKLAKKEIYNLTI